MYDDYFGNYNTQVTYQNGYDEYIGYENDYDRFMPRQVNAFPYANSSYSNNMVYSNSMNNNKTELGKMYPEIYNKISPIIERKLGNNISSMDGDTLERLTFEVYDEFVKSDVGKKLNIQTNSVTIGSTTNNNKVLNKETENNKSSNLSNSSNNSFNNTRFNSNKISNRYTNTNVSSQDINCRTENQDMNRYINTKEVSNRQVRNNCLLCDLIKIMILNKWRENQRPSKPGHRPPFIQNPRPQIPWSQNIMPNGSEYYGMNMQNQSVRQRPSYFDVPYPEDFN